jgi:hypothetical protein
MIRKSFGNETLRPKLVTFVDPTEARNVAPFGPGDCALRRGIYRARRSSEARPGIGPTRWLPLWSSEPLGTTTAPGLNSYPRRRKLQTSCERVRKPQVPRLCVLVPVSGGHSPRHVVQRCRAGCARSGTGPDCRRSRFSFANRRSTTLSATARRTDGESVARSGDRPATQLSGRLR